MRITRNHRNRPSFVVANAIGLLTVVGFFSSAPASFAATNSYLVRTFEENGKQIDEIIVPGRPPLIKAEAVSVPIPHEAMGINSLSSVPAFTWCYGCSATSAGMMMGYYDNQGYADMYTGPANGGVCPLNNETYWGHTSWPSVTCGECPLVATHNGYDGRAIRGHVDDYWIDYNNAGPDPYIVNGWTEHTQGDCTADYMGTSQSKYARVDGSTTFYNYPDGSPLYDYTGAEPGKRDGCHGMKLFANSRGYTVTANFSQYIYGYNGNTLGFTYADFKSEIDAGRPVMIQVTGHSMVGYGYNDTGSIIYIHDTWDNSDHSMTWGGTYSGLQHYGVTVLRLAPVITVTATDATAGEPGSGQGTGTFTFSRTGSTAAALTVNFTVGGTATSGSDYTAIGTSCGFTAGSATATETVSVLDDNLVEGNETVVVTLAAGTGYTVGSPSAATVTISDDDATVTVAATDATAGEPSDSGTFTFTRAGYTAGALTVNFTVGGTATSGTDYTAMGTTVSFLPGRRRRPRRSVSSTTTWWKRTRQWW